MIVNISRHAVPRYFSCGNRREILRARRDAISFISATKFEVYCWFRCHPWHYRMKYANVATGSQYGEKFVALMTGVFNVDFTTWSKFTAVENHLVVKSIFGLVVTHIGFVYFQPWKVVLILIGVFKVDFTAWSILTAVENHLVGKFIFGLVVTHIGFVHFRP